MLANNSLQITMMYTITCLRFIGGPVLIHERNHLSGRQKWPFLPDLAPGPWVWHVWFKATSLWFIYMLSQIMHVMKVSYLVCSAVDVDITKEHWSTVYFITICGSLGSFQYKATRGYKCSFFVKDCESYTQNLLLLRNSLKIKDICHHYICLETFS